MPWLWTQTSPVAGSRLAWEKSTSLGARQETSEAESEAESSRASLGTDIAAN